MPHPSPIGWPRPGTKSSCSRGARSTRGGCTVVALVHNVLPHEQRRFDKQLMSALLRRADALVVHSGEQADLAATLASTPAHVAALPPHLPYGASAADTSPAGRRNRLL